MPEAGSSSVITRGRAGPAPLHRPHRSWFLAGRPQLDSAIQIRFAPLEWASVAEVANCDASRIDALFAHQVVTRVVCACKRYSRPLGRVTMPVYYKRRTRVLIQRKRDLIQTSLVLVVDARGVERKESRAGAVLARRPSRRRRYFMNGDRCCAATAGAGLTQRAHLW